MEKNSVFDSETGSAILFIGSGFSRDATNIMNKKLPTGFDLKLKLASIAGVDGSNYNFKDLSEYVADKKLIDIYDFMRNTFTISKEEKFHAEILSYKWKRIYTTNYDDLIRFAREKSKIDCDYFSHEDNKPKKFKDNSVVHLHGTIKNMEKDDALNALIMTDKSYIGTHIKRSQWLHELYLDIKYCSACYFIGYSLSDDHIASIILQNPEVVNKIYFINGNESDKIKLNKLEKYGIITGMTVSEFSVACLRMPKNKTASDPRSFKTIKYIDYRKDNKPVFSPTSIEVQDLILYGKYDYQRILTTWPDSSYIAPRIDLVNRAFAMLGGTTNLLVHSGLGNGKSIFVYALVSKLLQNGYKCFEVPEDSTPNSFEISALRRFMKVIVVFKSYDSAVSHLSRFNDSEINAKYIIQVRTGTYEVRAHEINSKISGNINSICIDAIDNNDLNNLMRLLDKSGLINKDRSRELISTRKNLRDIVLAIYNNSDVSEKIKNDIIPIILKSNFKEIFICTHILSFIDAQYDEFLLGAITGIDPYVEFSKIKSELSEIFGGGGADLIIKSAIFSSYIIKNYINVNDIINCIDIIIVTAMNSKQDKGMIKVLGRIMKYSTLIELINERDDANNQIKKFYEKIRNYEQINAEPLFWLQYSILMTNEHNYIKAYNFIGTAYDRAEKIKEFLTYQIDTFALNLYMKIDGDSSGQLKNTSKIVDLLEVFSRIMKEDSHRDFCMKVLSGFEFYYINCHEKFSIFELRGFLKNILSIIKTLESFPAHGDADLLLALKRSRSKIEFKINCATVVLPDIFPPNNYNK